MKQLIIALFIILFLVTSGYTEEPQPRTVSVYKRHMQSPDHDKGNFDHQLHHMLYLSGVADAYSINNERRAAEGLPLLYCLPDNTSLNGNDYIALLEQQINDPDTPLPDRMTVAEALLLALQEKFPCQQK